MAADTPPEVESAQAFAERLLDGLDGVYVDVNALSSLELTAIVRARDAAVRRAALEEATLSIEARRQAIAEYGCTGENCGGCELGRAARIVRTLAEKAAP